jgi:hypothetical protein
LVTEKKELPQKIGEYIEEGLGRVIYNPGFLLANNEDNWDLKKPKVKKNKPEIITASSDLSTLLIYKKQKEENELAIGRAVQKFMINSQGKFNKVSASQWGAIRSLCLQARDIDDLYKKLFAEQDIGFLMHGVSAQKYWNKGKIRDILQKTILDNQRLKLAYVIKLASEMAKWKQNQKDKK